MQLQTAEECYRPTKLRCSKDRGATKVTVIGCVFHRHLTTLSADVKEYIDYSAGHYYLQTGLAI